MRKLFAAVVLACSLFVSPAAAQTGKSYIQVRVIPGPENTPIEKLAIASVKSAIEASPEFVEMGKCSEACPGIVVNALEVTNGEGELLGVTVGVSFIFFAGTGHPIYINSGVYVSGPSPKSIESTGLNIVAALRESLVAFAANAAEKTPEPPVKTYKG